MKNRRIRSALDVLIEDGVESIYAIVIEKTSPIYARKTFPKPLQNWLEQNCPDVKVESLQPKIVGTRACAGRGETIKLSGATFYINFSPDQADAFAKAWNSPQLCRMSRDIWLANFSRQENDQPDQSNTYSTNELEKAPKTQTSSTPQACVP
jgi:hypothetical protein